MSVPAERRKQVQQEIAEWVAGHGKRHGDGAVLSERYPDVPTSTLLRWYKAEIHKLGAGAHQVARAAVKVAKTEAKKAQQRKTRSRRVTLGKTKPLLPEPVTPEAINPSTRSAIDQVRECVQHAENVLDYCTNDEGQIRNPKLYLAASNHMRNSVETLAKISERLNDAQRIEQVHAAIFEEIRKADPATAERILIRLQHLQELWGLQ